MEVVNPSLQHSNSESEVFIKAFVNRSVSLVGIADSISEPLLALSQFKNIKEMRSFMKKNALQILDNLPKDSQLQLEMKRRELSVNCWRKSGLISNPVKQHLAVLDGSKEDDLVLETAISMVGKNEHLFVVLPFKKMKFKKGFPEDELILNHKLQQVARHMMKRYEKTLDKSDVAFTVLIPSHKDPRVVVTAIAKTYNVQSVILKQSSKTLNHLLKQKYHRSLASFLSSKHKCELTQVPV